MGKGRKEGLIMEFVFGGNRKFRSVTKMQPHCTKLTYMYDKTLQILQWNVKL